MEAGQPIIACHELTRRFGAVEAVRGVDLDVRRGEFVALLGPNGAGKTTLVQMLATLLRPSSGRATVLGYDTVREAERVRASLGVVFQEPALDDRLTARENLAMHAALYRIPPARARAAIDGALRWSSLEEVARRRVRTLSGGMKRRLELARALMHDPALLFLDEPTPGLDPQGRRHLWARIEDLRARGVTILMTTHQIREAEACDRVGILDHGRLLAMDAPSALRARAGVGGEGTLEDAFIAMTGHGLRDEAAGSEERLLAFARKGGEHTR